MVARCLVNCTYFFRVVYFIFFIWFYFKLVFHLCFKVDLNLFIDLGIPRNFKFKEILSRLKTVIILNAIRSKSISFSTSLD